MTPSLRINGPFQYIDLGLETKKKNNNNKKTPSKTKIRKQINSASYVGGIFLKKQKLGVMRLRDEEGRGDQKKKKKKKSRRALTYIRL